MTDDQELSSLMDQLDALESEAEEPQPAYTSLADWVYFWLAPVIERRLRRDAGITEKKLTTHWCKQWWRHPEVTLRLGALWHAWEALRQDPGTGMSVWIRDHFDPHWAQITSPDGPLANCDPDVCDGPLPQLPVEETPNDWRPPAI